MFGWISSMFGWRKNVVVSEGNIAKLSIALNVICVAWMGGTLYQLGFDNKKGQKIKHG